MATAQVPQHQVCQNCQLNTRASARLIVLYSLEVAMHAVIVKFLGVAITKEPLRSWFAQIGGNFSK